ncbi:MAG: hypothetical protein LJE92_06920 [Gammaproteobacteria bacterium]|jgi:hypothetical protein|nr:hypothetical protein [Gammaproteobacteria bacterium]
MITISTIIESTGRFFDTIARARVQSTLLTMGREWVERNGYSWELLRGGVSEWPWRQTTQAIATDLDTRRTIAELNHSSDREPHDLRIPTGGIENVARCDRADIDFEQDPEKSAA